MIDQVQPVLDSQTDTSDSIQAWAANLANITGQLQSEDRSVSGVLSKGPGAAEEVRALFDQLQPTLPIVLANLVSVGEVAVTYQPNLEQLLVLLPQGTAVTQAVGVAKQGTKQDYMGDYLTLNLNLNIPPPCNTGFLPAQQQRAPTFEDYPDRPAGDVYCRVPQDGAFNVRGARNIPCVTVPGKRAPTAKMCESNENYVPLERRIQLEGRPERDTVRAGRPAVASGFTTCRSASAAGSGTASDSGRRIRSGERHVRWTGRTCVHTVQPGPECRRGANMADDAAAPDGELTKATSERNPTAEQAESSAVEPESGAVELTDVVEDAKPAGLADVDEDVDEVEDDDAEDSVGEADGEAVPARTPMSHVKARAHRGHRRSSWHWRV